MKNHRPINLGCSLAAGAAAVLLAACAATDIGLDSRISLPGRFAQADGAGAAMPSSTLPHWWEAWNDAELTRLIEAGLSNNRDLAATQAKLIEARAISATAEADLGPTLGAVGGVGAHRMSADNPLPDNVRSILSRAGSDLSESRRTFSGNHQRIGFAARWEPDIFGAKESDADAARYMTLGNEEKLYGARMLLAADIADHYFKVRSGEIRQRLSRQTVATLEELLRYAQGRFAAGHVTHDTVESVTAKLAAAQAQESTLAAQSDAWRRMLAVLTGEPAQRFVLGAAPDHEPGIFWRIPPAPAGEAPSTVLNRRPDIRAYEAQIKAYAAKLASAKADLLPRFDLRFLWQTGRLEIGSDMPAIKGFGGLISAGVQLPIFTAGRIEANIAASDARLQGALAQYDHAILKALAEVDTSYQLQYALNRQSQWIAKSATHSEEQQTAAEKLYRHGKKTLDEALKARLEAQEMRERELQARVAEAQNMLNLYKALGGGIERR